jgi:hypothetical protein
MLGERKLLSIASCLAVILAPLLVASLFWASYRKHPSSPDPAKAVTVGRSSIASSMSEETARIDASGSEGLSNAQSAIMFSIAPLTSLSAMTPPVDLDPVASFRDLIAVPPDNAREAPHIDPRPTLCGSFDDAITRIGSPSTATGCIVILTAKPDSDDRSRVAHERHEDDRQD